MKLSLYPRLAFMGMSKNKKLYIPYFLTAMGLVMMYYIVAFLSASDLLSSMRGGRTAAQLLLLGSYVIAIFSLFFLFYSYSFLIRRRKSEFGLYNILGMGKGHLAGILTVETVVLFAAAFFFGTLFGVALSKLFELGLTNILEGAVSFRLSVSLDTVRNAFLLFGAIFLLLLFYTLFGIFRAGSLALLASEKHGEKEPKVKAGLALVGFVCLASAYTIAVTVKKPLTALITFFAAVILVIIGTYLLFMVGSVVLCRFLKRRKSYYYRPAHFVSVSSMSYRMKRNGAGLASIAILATMVLVMLSSTTCLYVGMEDSVRLRYPRDFALQLNFREVSNLSEENVAFFRDMVNSASKEAAYAIDDILDYRLATMEGRLQKGVFTYDEEALNSFSLASSDDLVGLYLLSLEDYNHMIGGSETLASDEVLLYPFNAGEMPETLTFGDGERYRVKRVLDDLPVKTQATDALLPGVFVVLPDFLEDLAPLSTWTNSSGSRVLNLRWFYRFNSDLPANEGYLLREVLHDCLRQSSLDEVGGLDWYHCTSAGSEMEDLFGTYGGLFFLGILLSVVFLFATVLMIYYKQISEGYEDQPRFAIMQKVGMTRKEIRRSINSQMKTVFFLPLLAAGLHMAFAFPIINRILPLLGMSNTSLFLITTLVSFLIFSLFYAIVYLITSEVYYRIVNGKKSGV